jgi:hypothetical protein
VTPDQDDCRPECHNIAYTDRDIDQLRVHIAGIRELLDESLAPSPRHQRARAELERLQRIIDNHDPKSGSANRTASTNWPHRDTDPQRMGILAAADRLLAGAPKRSSGNLSIVQLAIEANVKYSSSHRSTPTTGTTSSDSPCPPGARPPHSTTARTH